MRNTIAYYNAISETYDELYGDEQSDKFSALDLVYGGRVLDVGCGTSLLTRQLEAELVVGVDISMEMIQKGRASAVKYVVATAESLPFKNHAFDSIVSTTVLQDVANPKAALSEMVRVGKKTLVSVPSKSKLDLMGLAKTARIKLKEHFTVGKDRFYII